MGLLQSGRLVLNSSVAEIRKLVPRHVRIFFREPFDPPAELPSGFHFVERRPDQLTLEMQGTLAPLFHHLPKWPVLDLEVEEPRLENFIIAFCDKNKGEGVDS